MSQFNKLGIDNELGASNDVNMTIVLPANHEQGCDWLPKSHSSSQGHCLHTFSWYFETITGNMKQLGAATTMLGNEKLKHHQNKRPNSNIDLRLLSPTGNLPSHGILSITDSCTNGQERTTGAPATENTAPQPQQITPVCC